MGEGNMGRPMGAGRVLVLDIVLMKRRIYRNESQEEYRASKTGKGGITNGNGCEQDVVRDREEGGALAKPGQEAGRCKRQRGRVSIGKAMTGSRTL